MDQAVTQPLLFRAIVTYPELTQLLCKTLLLQKPIESHQNPGACRLDNALWMASLGDSLLSRSHKGGPEPVFD